MYYDKSYNTQNKYQNCSNSWKIKDFWGFMKMHKNYWNLWMDSPKCVRIGGDLWGLELQRFVEIRLKSPLLELLATCLNLETRKRAKVLKTKLRKYKNFLKKIKVVKSLLNLLMHWVNNLTIGYIVTWDNCQPWT